MMFTTPMRLLCAAALGRDSKAIAGELLGLGLLDAVSVKELPGNWAENLRGAAPDARSGRVRELRKRAEGFFALAEPPLALPDLTAAAAADSTPLDLGQAERRLGEISTALEGVRERQKAVQDELAKLEDLRRQVEAQGATAPGKDSTAASGSTLLDLRAGSVASGGIAVLERALAGLPAVVAETGSSLPSRQGLMLISLKRDASRVEAALAQADFRAAEEGQAPDERRAGILKDLAAKEDSLRAERERRAREFAETVEAHGPALRETWSRLRIEELAARIDASFARTDRAVVISGWIPEAEAARAEAALRKATKGVCYIEWNRPEGVLGKGVEPPVAMSNPRMLKPFQDLVTNYALPEYGTIDPTPFVAAAYLAMFGLMFGDAGHGLVLSLIGLLGTLRARKRGSKDGLFVLISYCGAAAIVAGLLFGSFFGMKLFPPLWFDYHGAVLGHASAASGPVTSIYGILGVTVRFGIAVMGLGMVLNWINLIRKRRWFELVFDKAGLLGATIYGAGAWAAFYFVAREYKALPPASFLGVFLGLPTLALALKAPLEAAREAREARRKGEEPRRHGPFAALNFLLEWVVEILEIYSGYLANTLSFMRVAGLGIAHVSLMVAFAQIAAMASPGGSSAVSILIMVAGNALVIALEGLSAGIQSLRLNYYEFFSKYFNGTGRAYRPISLRSKEG